MPAARSDRPSTGDAGRRDDDDRAFELSRVFDAPRETVWRAFTDPKQVVLWWGPNGFTTTTHEMEVKKGGRWRYVMRGPDGRDYPNKSVYLEVDPPARLVYAHGWDRPTEWEMFRATITLEDVGGKTRVTMRMVFPTAAERDATEREFGAVEGGRQTLARLAEHLAAAAKGAR